MTINSEISSNTYLEIELENSSYTYRLKAVFANYIHSEISLKKYHYVWLKSSLKENLMYYLENTIGPEKSTLFVFLVEQSDSNDKNLRYYQSMITIDLIDIGLPIIQDTSGNYILCSGENDPVIQAFENRRIKPFKDFRGDN
jgi:hypothetical protein